MYDVQSGQSTQIAKHDAPIRVIKYVDTPSGGIVVTGSWDKTIKVRDYHHLTLTHAHLLIQYWDIRSQNPVSSVTLPERCYSLDVSYPLMVVGTAERHIQIFNLTSPTAPYKVRPKLGIFCAYLTMVCVRLWSPRSSGKLGWSLASLRQTDLRLGQSRAVLLSSEVSLRVDPIEMSDHQT